MPHPTLVLAALLGLPLLPARAEPPRVDHAIPDNADVGVDPALTSIRVVFDQDMSPRGFSICGGGPDFPKLTGKPSWSDPRTLVLPVKLEPGHFYTFSINCPAAQNFRGAATGEPAVMKRISFRTASPSVPHEGEVTPEANRESFAKLRDAINSTYSHRDRLDLDWNALIDQAAAEPLPASTRGAFVRAILPVLAHARDPHITVLSDSMRFGTFAPDTSANAEPALIAKLVPSFLRRNDVVATGRYDDGVGYIQINSWPGDASLLAPAHEALDAMLDAPGLIVDVRLNGGGDEVQARAFAARLIDARAVYSRSRFRDDAATSGFTPLRDRVIEPAPEASRYKGRIVVLQGQACMSSNESFLLMVATSPRVTRIGATSYGSSGNPRPVELPNNVTVLLPTWQDFAPDGTPIEGRGVDPDVMLEPIHPTPRDIDPVLDTALRKLRGQQ